MLNVRSTAHYTYVYLTAMSKHYQIKSDQLKSIIRNQMQNEV